MVVNATKVSQEIKKKKKKKKNNWLSIENITK